jgi:hypothetical protein
MRPNRDITVTKTKPTDSILEIKVGEKDHAGNKIINVLATNNEFAIYEIEHTDINSRLRVRIDGHTDESEKLIQDRFNKVKQGYIEAKGLLSRASNYGMMKQRIAHTLATCLNSESVDGNKEFKLLIDTIMREHESLVWNRAIYLFPCIFAVVVLFLASLYIASAMDNNDRHWQLAWQVFTSLLAASLGGGLSMLVTAKTLNFEEYTAKIHYLTLGLERLILACMAGAFAFVAIKSEIAFPKFASSNHWAFMAVLILSGFSESLVPSMLGKLQTKDA